MSIRWVSEDATPAREQMRRPQVVLSLAVMVSGLCLLLRLSCARGQDKPIPFEDDSTLPAPVKPLSGCPPLPEQAAEGTVAVYVAKMQEKLGSVCARAVNGIPPPIGYDGFHLQRRKEGQFHDFTEPMPPMPPGVIIGEDASRFEMVIGSRLDRQFPRFGPAPPGTYRVCFRYTLHHMITE